MNVEKLLQETNNPELFMPCRVEIADLNLDAAINARVEINQSVVEEYKDLFRDKEETMLQVPSVPKVNPLNPCVLRAKTGGFYILDGWHRVLAAKALGLDRIVVTLYGGDRTYTLEEARVLSATVNTAHGLRRSDADKRKAVTILLTDEPGRTNDATARLAGVSPSLVAAVRREMVDAGTLTLPQTTAEKVQAAIDKAGGKKLSVRQLAEAAGVSKSTAARAAAEASEASQKSKNDSGTVNKKDKDAKALDKVSRKAAEYVERTQPETAPAEQKDSRGAAERRRESATTAAECDNLATQSEPLTDGEREFRQIEAIVETLYACRVVELTDQGDKELIGYCLSTTPKDAMETTTRIVAALKSQKDPKAAIREVVRLLSVYIEYI